MEGLADVSGVGGGVDGGDELPEIEGVSEVEVRAWREVWVEGDDGRVVGGEVVGDGVFACEPGGALARAVFILHDACDESLGEADDEGVAVLEDDVAVWGDVVLSEDFGDGLDGWVEVCGEHGVGGDWGG